VRPVQEPERRAIPRGKEQRSRTCFGRDPKLFERRVVAIVDPHPEEALLPVDGEPRQVDSGEPCDPCLRKGHERDAVVRALDAY
jgi:hypothetical protein